jgi:hypothetical protein
MNSHKPERRPNGTYAKGSTGNEKGRTRKAHKIPHPANIRDMHYDAAEFGIRTTINGKRVKTNLVFANALTLGLAGAAGDKAAARDFLKFIHMCTEQELRTMREITEAHQHAVPAYLTETDPVRRAQLKRDWDAMWADASGERPKTTSGLGRRTQH